MMINPTALKTIGTLVDEIKRDAINGDHVTTAIVADLITKELADLVQVGGEPGIIISVQHAFSLTELVKFTKVYFASPENNTITPEHCEELIEALKT